MMFNLTIPFKLLRTSKKEIKDIQKKIILDYISIECNKIYCCLCLSYLKKELVICDKCFEKLYPSSIKFNYFPVVEYAIILKNLEKEKYCKILKKDTKNEPYSVSETKEVYVTCDCSSFSEDSSTEYPDLSPNIIDSGIQFILSIPEQFFSISTNDANTDNTRIIESIDDNKHTINTTNTNNTNFNINVNNIPKNNSLTFNEQEIIKRILEYEVKNKVKDEIAILENLRHKIKKNLSYKWKILQNKLKIEVIEEQLKALKLKYLICMKNLEISEVISIKKNMLELKEDYEKIKKIVWDECRTTQK